MVKLMVKVKKAVSKGKDEVVHLKVVKLLLVKVDKLLGVKVVKLKYH